MSSTNTQSKIPLAKYRPFYNVRIAVAKGSVRFVFKCNVVRFRERSWFELKSLLCKEDLHVMVR